MKVVAVTEKGRRDVNEDCFFKYSNDKLYGGLVADGMGGHNKGDIASKLAGDVIKDYIMSHFTLDMDSFDVSELMRTAVVKANDKIYDMSRKNPICRGMGTTVTMAMVCGKWLITAHVGDSRAYLVNDYSAEPITKDHSYVRELVERGVITPEEAKKHPKRNSITRAVGTERSIMVDINVREYNGEVVVLCTDGLWAYVSNQEICDTIRHSKDLEEASTRLKDMALLNESTDNITAVVFKGEKKPEKTYRRNKL